jgi:hypothetical protein
LLSNKIFTGILITSLAFLISCGDSDEKKVKAPLKDYNDPSVQLREAKSFLGNNAKITFLGNFDKDKKEELVAGLEINNKDEWGIKFTAIDITKEKPEKLFETNLLEGSIEESRIEKLNLSGKDYDLLYYNSRDFFMGSGGGEVFSYIIDFNEKQTYYAHLIADNKKVALFLSDNIEDDKVRQFFMNTFKNDFPSYVLIEQDIEYEE